MGTLSLEGCRSRSPDPALPSVDETADGPTLLGFWVYQTFGRSIAKSTSQNVQVKLATGSPSGVGLTLIAQAPITADTLEAETNATGRKRYERR